jgi:type IV pilus assembly protein PilA
VIVVVLVLIVGLVAVVVPVIGIVAAIAIPNFVAYQLKAKRAEVPANVSGIRIAELAYQAAFDKLVPAGSREEALASLTGKQQHAWAGGPAWDTLDWRPSGPIRGAYWVEVDGDTFTVHGICDVDADGTVAEYVATADESPTLVSGYDTF